MALDSIYSWRCGELYFLALNALAELWSGCREWIVPNISDNFIYSPVSSPVTSREAT